MSAYKTQQRRITHRGREFHFVSCEGTKANPARGIEETGPTWSLMAAGKRWDVMPEMPDESEAETDRRLMEWLKAHIPARAAAVAHEGDPANGRP